MVSLIGKKVGMTQVFSEEGLVVPVTVIKVEPNVIIREKTESKDGYHAYVVGSIDKRLKSVNKPDAGQYLEGITPKECLIEMKGAEGSHKIGDSFGVEIFEDISFVDVTGTSKGKGFQGGMKRHGFGGGPSAHGSKFHRALGGTGQNTKPSKVFKGRKMPGRMGNDRKTVECLEVVMVDKERNAILVKGAVPGTRDSIVFIRKAIKK